jgi:hypothetical protein
MARKARNGGVNMSESIRQVLKESPEMKAKEIVATLAKKGIKVAEGLVYFIKGKMKGKKGRRRKARQMVEKVTATMSNNGAAITNAGDVVATILKVKHLAANVGGLKKLKQLVDALNE